jgi:hypothetical protein
MSHLHQQGQDECTCTQGRALWTVKLSVQARLSSSSIRKEQVMVTFLHIGNTHPTHGHFLHSEPASICNPFCLPHPGGMPIRQRKLYISSSWHTSLAILRDINHSGVTKTVAFFNSIQFAKSIKLAIFYVFERIFLLLNCRNPCVSLT